MREHHARLYVFDMLADRERDIRNGGGRSASAPCLIFSCINTSTIF
jgi:hypothetical protein